MEIQYNNRTLQFDRGTSMFFVTKSDVSL